MFFTSACEAVSISEAAPPCFTSTLMLFIANGRIRWMIGAGATAYPSRIAARPAIFENVRATITGRPSIT